MNAKKWIAVVFVSSLLSVRAEEDPARFDTSTKVPTLPPWSIPKWDELERPPAKITLGKSEYVLSGALVETFRPPRRYDTDRTFVQKLFDLPILNMIVPAPMPKTSNGGKYFAWGERSEPWSSLGERSRPGPQGVLVSVSR